MPSEQAVLCFTGGAITRTLLVRRSDRAKTMRLRVDPRTGTVLLTVPRRTSERRALAWAAEQRGWIEAALAEIPPPATVGADSFVPLYGEAHRVDWRRGTPRAVRVEPGLIVTGGPVDTISARILRWLRAHAQDVLDRETRACALAAGVTVARIGVGDPVSRWGSCSSTGSIRYSWRLILAPEHVRRATVAHEVAHRVHMNHSREFHALVKQLFGSDPGPARRWLRSNGASLHRFGRL